MAMDTIEVAAILPHRYPFLLVDRVVEIETGRRIVALKNVTVNEPFFSGHFPGHPIMPGVLLCEAVVQAGGILARSTAADTASEGTIAMLTALDRVRFRQQVTPGDQLRLAWPAAFSGFVLETKDALGPAASWLPAGPAPVVIGDQNVVTVDIAGQAQFFRLRK